MAKKPKLRRFFGETKPKHDELTKWTSAGTLKSDDIWNAYQHLATNYGAAPLIPDSWVQSVLAGQIPAGSFSHSIGNISAPTNHLTPGDTRPQCCNCDKYHPDFKEKKDGPRKESTPVQGK